MGLSGVNPIRSSQNVSSISSTSHHFTPEMKEILSALGVQSHDMIQFSEQPGGKIPAQIQSEISVVNVNQITANLIKALGLGLVDLSIVPFAEDEIKRIKKKLKDIQQSCLDKKEVLLLLASLGIDPTVDQMIFSEDTGGILLLKEAFEKIEIEGENNE
jgi:hypothetical protein